MPLLLTIFVALGTVACTVLKDQTLRSFDELPALVAKAKTYNKKNKASWPVQAVAAIQESRNKIDFSVFHVHAFARLFFGNSLSEATDVKWDDATTATLTVAGGKKRKFVFLDPTLLAQAKSLVAAQRAHDGSLVDRIAGTAATMAAVHHDFMLTMQVIAYIVFIPIVFFFAFLKFVARRH